MSTSVSVCDSVQNFSLKLEFHAQSSYKLIFFLKIDKLCYRDENCNTKLDDFAIPIIRSSAKVLNQIVNGFRVKIMRRKMMLKD